MAIVTLDQAKAQLNITSTANDDELQGYVDAVTGAVEHHLHQVVDRRSVVDEIELCGRSSFRLWSAPVISLTSVVSLDGATTYDVAGLHASASGVVRVLSGPAPTGWVAVTYDAGYATIPDQIVRGALIILQHLWETQRGASGAVRSLATSSDESYDPRYSYSIPRRALELLGPPTPTVA